MPLGTLGELVRRLLAAGVEPGRPVSAVCNATRPDERVVHGTIATIEPLVRAHDLSGPCVVLIGSVLRSRQETGAVSASSRTA
jgi:siroheme synthase